MATIDVTLFIKQKDGKFTRLDETHTQYVYSKDEITDTLLACGLRVVEIEGHLGEAVENSDRICFLAVKE